MPELNASEILNVFKSEIPCGDFIGCVFKSMEYIDNSARIISSGEKMSDQYRLIFDMPSHGIEGHWVTEWAKLGKNRKTGDTLPLQQLVDAINGSAFDPLQQKGTLSDLMNAKSGTKIDLYFEERLGSDKILRATIKIARPSKKAAENAALF